MIRQYFIGEEGKVSDQGVSYRTGGGEGLQVGLKDTECLATERIDAKEGAMGILAIGRFDGYRFRSFQSGHPGLTMIRALS